MRSIHKVARNLARKQLNGKDIRSKIASESEYSNWEVNRMRKLVKEYYEIEVNKQNWQKRY